MGTHSRQGQTGAMALGKMATAKVRRQGRPRGDAEQRSVRLPRGLWPTLQTICSAKNLRRDPLIEGKVTPSAVINMAVREWLTSQGYDASCYLEVADEEAA